MDTNTNILNLAFNALKSHLKDFNYSIKHNNCCFITLQILQFLYDKDFKLKKKMYMDNDILIEISNHLSKFFFKFLSDDDVELFLNNKYNINE
jgi:hypothetical protein